MNTPTKPFILKFAEAKSAINSAINEAIHQHNIPCTLLESVLAEALLKVEAGARREKEAVLRSYDKEMAEAMNNNEEKEEEEGEGSDGS